MIIETTTPLSEIKEDGVTVVYVTASWCGPCKVYGPQVAELALAETDVTFLKADADAAMLGLGDLVLKHKTILRSIPTTYIFEDGELRDGFTGNDIKMLTEILAKFK